MEVEQDGQRMGIGGWKVIEEGWLHRPSSNKTHKTHKTMCGHCRWYQASLLLIVSVMELSTRTKCDQCEIEVGQSVGRLWKINFLNQHWDMVDVDWCGNEDVIVGFLVAFDCRNAFLLQDFARSAGHATWMFENVDQAKCLVRDGKNNAKIRWWFWVF